jgi:hypothetical protein
MHRLNHGFELKAPDAFRARCGFEYCFGTVDGKMVPAARILLIEWHELAA